MSEPHLPPIPHPCRYLTYSKYFVPGGPIFFYAGNEADVML